MVTEKPLSGLRILVTRPAAQTDVLADSIRSMGGEPVIFPLITIQPIAANSWPLIDFRKSHWLIFISRNAVNYFFTGLSQPLPSQLKLAVVGNGTATALKQLGKTIHLQPFGGGGSDSLLTMQPMQQLAGQRVVIVRGQGGREHLSETLQARGASVRYIEVYRRQLPQVTAEQKAMALQADILMATSVQSVSNMLELFAKVSKQMMKKPLVVLSERIRQYARTAGFKHIVVTENTSDVAIMQRLIETGVEYGQQQSVR